MRGSDPEPIRVPRRRTGMVRSRILVSLTALGVVGAGLVGCGEQTMADEDPSAGTASSTPVWTGKLPSGIPTPPGSVSTGVPVTVLDDGDGPQLCLAGALESLPPQCSGLELVGWDWAEHDGDYEKVRGTRWGEFVVTGDLDGTTLAPTEVLAAADYREPPSGEGIDVTSPATSCAEPEGGWVVDPSRVSFADQDAAFRVARRLVDYADSFIDTSLDARSPEQIDQDLADGSDDVSPWIVNVSVTQDTAAAEAAIREVWGGGLCVTEGELTQRDVRQVQRSLHEGVPGVLGSGVAGGVVEVAVVYDDGSIQAWADEEYGAGRVEVSSALSLVG